MNRWIVFLSVLLMMFASSGAHKLVDAKIANDGLAALSVMAEEPETQLDECCENKHKQSTAKHSTCGIPDVASWSGAFVQQQRRSSAMQTFDIVMPAGLRCGLPKRPPKHALT